jgi:MscS family membrane protein
VFALSSPLFALPAWAQEASGRAAEAQASSSPPSSIVSAIVEHVPEPLRRMGPAQLMWWQWLALPVLVVLCWLLGRLLASVSRRILVRLSRRTDVMWDDALVARSTGPLTLLWSLVFAYVALGIFSFSAPAEAKIDLILRTGVTIAVFWGVLRGVDLVCDVLSSSPTLQGTARALLPLLARIAKVAVMAMLLVAVLSGFGLPVASLLAGLGVGGIALALAAQKTVENVFGAVSIGVDVPFQVGDFVKIGDVVGNVETTGLRSTRIRTLDRTLVTIPNGALADARIESYAARDRLRFSTSIGLEYGTRESQMRAVLEQIEAALRAHPRIWPDTVIVRFAGFGASSLDIDIMAWFLTKEFDEFRGFRQQVLLEIMAIVERNGASFAFPTRTLHVHTHDAAAP